MSFIETITNISFLGFDHWGLVLIFFTTVIEAIPLLGLFSPGMVFIIAGGFMAKLGILDIGNILIVAASGAILGDLIGYLLGKKYGFSFLDKYGKFFFFRKKQFDNTKHIMNNHTGKALIIGRFNSFTRSFAPFIAGSTNTKFSQFLIFNIIGGVAWASVFVGVGYVFGNSYKAASGYIGKFMTIAIVLSIGIVYLYRFIDTRKHIFYKYHLYTLIVNIFSLYIFSKMIEDVIDHESTFTFDIWLNSEIVGVWSLRLNEVMLFITNIASPLYLSLFSLILLVILFIKKKWYYSILLLMGMGGGLVLETLIKLLIHRERPVNSFIEASGYSFPSGHATMAMIFFMVLLFSLKDDIKDKTLRTLFITVTITAPLLVGTSRIYLNVHWFSDVIAGLALGLFWITLLVLIFKFILAIAGTVIYNVRDLFFERWFK